MLTLKRGGVFLGLDILNFIQDNMQCSFIDYIMIFFTSIANCGTIWILTGIILLFNKKYRIYGIMLLISLLVTFFIGELFLKNLINRPRPFIINPEINLIINKPISSSFPSGHTASSFSSAFILFKLNKKLGISAFVVAFLIGFSRMYLYVHYLSDILAGILLGLLCSLCVYTVFKKRGLLYVKDRISRDLS